MAPRPARAPGALERLRQLVLAAVCASVELGRQRRCKPAPIAGPGTPAASRSSPSIDSRTWRSSSSHRCAPPPRPARRRPRPARAAPADGRGDLGRAWTPWEPSRELRARVPRRRSHPDAAGKASDRAAPRARRRDRRASPPPAPDGGRRVGRQQRERAPGQCGVVLITDPSPGARRVDGELAEAEEPANRIPLAGQETQLGAEPRTARGVECPGRDRPAGQRTGVRLHREAKPRA